MILPFYFHETKEVWQLFIISLWKIDNGKCWGLYTAYGSGGVQSTAPNWRYPYTTEWVCAIWSSNGQTAEYFHETCLNRSRNYSCHMLSYWQFAGFTLLDCNGVWSTTLGQKIRKSEPHPSLSLSSKVLCSKTSFICSDVTPSRSQTNGNVLSWTGWRSILPKQRQHCNQNWIVNRISEIRWN